MRRILVLSPHPDDETLGCGGSLCRHVQAGDDIRVVFLTSGEKGIRGRLPAESSAVREGEARRAAAILGLEDLHFWREPDGALRVTRRLVERLRRECGARRPDIIYSTHGEELHPDHRALTRLVRAALRESGGPQRPEVRLYEVWTPLSHMDEIVDITPFVRKKRTAIRCYRSQEAVIAFSDAILGLNRYRGEMHCWPEGDYAEVFQILR